MADWVITEPWGGWGMGESEGERERERENDNEQLAVHAFIKTPSYTFI